MFFRPHFAHVHPHSHPHHCGRRGGFGGFGPPDFAGFGMGEHGFGRGGHGGRGRRMFDGSELRLVLLALIAEAPRHGYDLIREIEERTGGAYAPSPGVVYPTLTMLEDLQLIEERKSEGAKKQFAITDLGKTELDGRADEVAAVLARLADLGAKRARASGGPIRRAMGNLRVALQQRLGEGDADSQTMHAIAAILDEAAQKIERL